MSGEHSHGSISAGAAHVRPLAIAFGLTAGYAVVEIVAGIVFDSLVLVSDAGHMLTDVLGLGMAIAAILLARGRGDPGHTFGLYRLEMLAALANAVLLFGVAAYVLYEAAGRLSDPPEVPGTPLIVVASVGLLVNVVSFMLLRAGAKESLNVRGAFLEVISDMLGSVGALTAGAILLATGWPYADPIFGAAIGLFILPRAWRLGRDAVRVLLEAAPKEVDMGDVADALGAVPGVSGVHDIHLWTLTSGFRLATGHLVLECSADLGSVLRGAQDVLRERYEVEHATLQCEPGGFVETRKEI